MSKKQNYCIALYPEEKKKIETHLSAAGAISTSEFVEKAINFYCGYLDIKDDSEYTPQVLLGAMDGTVKLHTSQVNRNIFKTAVELDLLSNLIASMLEISPETITRARASSVERVKHINGIVGFESAYKRQKKNGDEE